MRDKNAYLKTGKWTRDRVYKILTNSIYIEYCRKPQDVLRVENSVNAIKSVMIELI